MDLSKLETKDSEVLKVVGPDGKETDIVIELYSADSEAYEEALAEFRDRITKKKSDEKFSGKETRELDAIILARCTKGWTGISWKGEELPFSHKNAIMIYQTPGLKWLRERVSMFINNRENYLGN